MSDHLRNGVLSEILGNDLACITPEALCRDLKTDDFFPEKKLQPNALLMCDGCPLFQPCRDYALARPLVYGIWGGTTDKDRHAIREGRPPITDTRKPATNNVQCGTRNGYNLHLRRHEVTCDPCRDAERVYRLTYNREKRSA